LPRRTPDNIFAFCSLCQALLFALFSLSFQPAQPWKPTFRPDASARPGRYTRKDTSWRELHWQKSAF
jgi:hypothetical protein